MHKLVDAKRMGASTSESRAEAWRATHDFDRAISGSTEAIRLNPKLAAAYNNRGAAWMELREYDQANRSGDAWRIPRDYLSAMADFDATIGIDPRFATAYFNRGLL